MFNQILIRPFIETLVDLQMFWNKKSPKKELRFGPQPKKQTKTTVKGYNEMKKSGHSVHKSAKAKLRIKLSVTRRFFTVDRAKITIEFPKMPSTDISKRLNPRIDGITRNKCSFI